MRRSKLLEGMWSGDLADLVQPLVSVDEYKSKIDATAIAIGFYVTDKDAAEDLNRFIQKSPVALIDTDVSPAPDQRGYYLVFIEIESNDRLVSSITAILDEVGPLASIENWQMKVRNQPKMMPYDQEQLGGFLKVNRVQDELAALKMQIVQFKKKKEQDRKDKIEKAEKAKQEAHKKQEEINAAHAKIEKQKQEKAKAEKEKASKTDASKRPPAKEQPKQGGENPKQG